MAERTQRLSANATPKKNTDRAAADSLQGVSAASQSAAYVLKLTGSKMSDSIVWPATRKKGPVVPLMIHSVVKSGRLLAKAQPTEHRSRTAPTSRYVLRRPTMTLMGSQRSAESAMDTRTPALAVVMLVGDVPRPSATSMVAAMMAVLTKVSGSAIQQTTNRMIHRRHVGSSATTSSAAWRGMTISAPRRPGASPGPAGESDAETVLSAMM
jgi:hypothetical protein